MQSLFELNYTKLAEKPFDVTLKHPETGEPLEDKKTGEKMYWSIYGADSEVYEEAKKKELFERILYEQENEPEGSEKTVDSLMSKSALLEESSIETIAEITTGGMLYGIYPDKPEEWTEVTKDNAAELLKMIKWIKPQVEEAALDRKNLTSESKKK